MHLPTNDHLEKPSAERSTLPGHFGLLLGGVLLLLGLAWLSVSAVQALGSGPHADVWRQWVVGQYLLHGINPYQSALAVLDRACGPVQSLKLSETRLYQIPPYGEDDRVVQPPWALALGPPEATYPPSASLLLTLLIGWLPQGAVAFCWLVVNGLALVGAIVLLAERYPLASKGVWATLCVVGVFLLLWPPTQRAVGASQFSLPVLCCLLLSWRTLEKSQLQSGWWLALALIKPSLALPFLMLPLVRRRWGCLGLALGMHGIATLLMSLWLQCPPWWLPAQWVQVAGYFTQGTYTIQDVLNLLRWENTPQGLALVAAFLLASLGWCWRHRQAGQRWQIELLCFVSLFWTYHGSYDFVLLLPPLLGLVDGALRDPRRGLLRWSLVAVCVGVVGLALWPPVYSAEGSPVCHALRWAGRGVLVCWFVATVWHRGRAEPTGTEGILPPLEVIPRPGLRASA